MVVICSEI